MNHILVEPDEPDGLGCVVLRDEHAAHACGVLYAGPGRCLKVGIVNGPTGEAVVESCETDGVTQLCSFEAELPPEGRRALFLTAPAPQGTEAALDASGHIRVAIPRCTRLRCRRGGCQCEGGGELCRGSSRPDRT